MMMVKALWMVLLISLLSTGHARDRSADLPQGSYFRHTSPEGVVHLNRTLTREAIEQGYELLDRQGRVLEQVEAQPVMDEAAREARRARLRAEREQRQRDVELQRLYGGPEDAERARDRNLAALQLSISYAENTLAQLQDNLDREIAQAARVERAGREVPEEARAIISRLQRQIASTEEEIAQYQRDIEATREQFGPVIRRLEQLQAER